MAEKLLLVDGHSIMHRAFYGMPELSNSKGVPTGAVYGFLNILFKVLDNEKPDYLVVAFDVHAKTFRHKMFAEYKGTRKPMPDELRPQIPLIKDVLKAMNIKTIELEGYEADDVLGTTAKKAESLGMDVTLMSGDRDLLQIATDRIKISIPKTKAGGTTIEEYYAKDVEELYQLDPITFIELKALMGDSSDNIPGVPKVGEKTAIGLLLEYKSLDGIYEHLEEITKNAIRESLRANKDLAYLCKDLATICTTAPVELSFEDASLGDLYTPEAYDFFKQLEFKNFLGRFSDKGSTKSVEIKGEYLTSVSDIEKSIESIKGDEGSIYIYPIFNTDANGEKKDVVTADGPEAYKYLVAIGYGSKNNGPYAITSEFKNFFGNISEFISEKRRVITANSKQLYPFFEELDLVDIQNPESRFCFFDVLLGAYLNNPLKNDYEIEDVALEYAGITLPTKKELLVKKNFLELKADEESKLHNYLYGIVKTLEISEPKEEETLKNKEMWELFYSMEMPLSFVLYKMEIEGIKVKADDLAKYSESLDSQIELLEKRIIEACGEEFNINSPKQLGEILFEKLKLPGSKKTKSGYSTAADVLEKLAPDYPVVKDILEYRGLTKLKSTYGEGLKAYIGDDERIHTKFNQTITATGRISSTEPNLQNIPIRMELGRQIRKVFVPKDNCVFIDADYSQIELRLLAHMSQDEALIEAYKTDEDIHKITASKVFGVPLDEVTPLMRRNAKAVNFGIVYGISSFGLSQDLDISKAQAKEYINQYFETYPHIKSFLDRLVFDAKEKGYSETMYKRQRPMPELKSSNFMQRSFGERVAMNAPIQGSAADIMKLAMLKVYEGLRDAGLKTKILLQVHDELLLEAPVEEKEIAEKILCESMKNAVTLSVPLEVEASVGNNWYEAK